MERQPVPSPHAATVIPLHAVEEGPVPLEEMAAQAVRIAVGLIALSVEAIVYTIGKTLGDPGTTPVEDGEAETPPGTAAVAAGAAMGAAFGLVRWGARSATTLVRTADLALRPVTSSGPFRDAMQRVRSQLESLDERWREERPRDEGAAGGFLKALVPAVVDALLDQLNPDEILDQRVDVGRVASRIDVDEIVARADLQRAVDRIDLDAVASRIDVEAIVRRLDLAAIAQEVIDELDLPEIIRESMGTMTTETVGGIRVQSMNADRAISRLVDRLLRRSPEGADRPEGPA